MANRYLAHDRRSCTFFSFCVCSCRWCFWNHWRDLLQLPAATRPTQLELAGVAHG